MSAVSSWSRHTLNRNLEYYHLSLLISHCGSHKPVYLYLSFSSVFVKACRCLFSSIFAHGHNCGLKVIETGLGLKGCRFDFLDWQENVSGKWMNSVFSFPLYPWLWTKCPWARNLTPNCSLSTAVCMAAHCSGNTYVALVCAHYMDGLNAEKVFRLGINTVIKKVPTFQFHLPLVDVGLFSSATGAVSKVSLGWLLVPT